jgi:hypothetical protein
VAEPAFGQSVETMRVAAGVERIGHQLRVVVIADGDAGLRKHHGVELDIEADLQDPRRFQQRAQGVERVTGRDLVRREAGCEQARAIAGLFVAERDIAGVVLRKRHRDAADFGLHRIDRRRLGLDGDMTGIVNARDKGVELVEAADGLILAAIDPGLARRLGARGGERDRGEGLGIGLAALRHARCAAPSLEGKRWGGRTRIVEKVVFSAASFAARRRRRKHARTALVAGIRLDVRRIDLRIFGDAAGESGKFHRLQECDQLACIWLVHSQISERHLERDLVIEQHQLA